MKYPSGRQVAFHYDAAGRLEQVTGYASGMKYHGGGMLKEMTLGNTVVESRGYNDRMQPETISAVRGASSLLSLTLAYGNGVASQNNGNVTGQTIVADGKTLTQSYTYEGTVNRLTAASETNGGLGWSQGYIYDSYGNRSLSTNLPWPLWQPSGFNVDTNEATTGWGFDHSGNATSLGSLGMTYDAENRMVATTGSSSSQYTYDGEGRRVKSVVLGVTKTYVYDAGGNLAAEYGGTGTAGRVYVTADHLGSTRMLTDGSGNVVERRDYAPFGEVIDPAGCTQSGAQRSPRCDMTGYGLDAGVRMKYTGKERDGETGLDYFGARYAGVGRFVSPDAPFADQNPEDPQSWNLYSYTRNNPLRYVDPNGEGVVEGVTRWVDRTGFAFVSLVLEPEKTIPAAASGIWNAVSNPRATFSAIGTGLQSFANASLDDKVTTLTEVSLDLGTAALTGGATRGTAIGTTLKELPILANAQNAAEALAGKTGRGTAMVGAAYDIKTGAVAAGKSGGIEGAVNPQVAGRAAPLGGVGAQVPGVKGKVGNCFECSTANRLANQGSNLNNVRHTQGIRPRNNERFNKCPNCEVMFPEQ